MWEGKTVLFAKKIIPVLIAFHYLYLQLTLTRCTPTTSSIGAEYIATNQNLQEGDTTTATAHHNQYMAGPLESYFGKHHYNASGVEGRIFFQRGCPIWREETASPKYQDLQVYIEELRKYMESVDQFQNNASIDIRTQLYQRGPTAREDICSKVEVHEASSGGLPGIFASGELSFSPVAGHMEPLLPPLRHPLLCYDNPDIYNYYLKAKRLLDLSYIVHDFGFMCRQLQPTSRIVLIDMGASLKFHESYSEKLPAVYLTDIFRKFGFPFDHIYAFEITKTEPEVMVNSIPEHLRAAYHWINVGVNPDVDSVNNPLNLIHNHFNEEDVVIVKLDIDNDKIENQFIQQLLEDERFHTTGNNTKPLIDHFYWEHHLDHRLERKESIQLFSELREQGIPAHYWV